MEKMERQRKERTGEITETQYENVSDALKQLEFISERVRRLQIILDKSKSTTAKFVFDEFRSFRRPQVFDMINDDVAVVMDDLASLEEAFKIIGDQ